MSALVLLVSMAVVAAEGSVVRVPRGPAPVIDGAIGDAEWKGAAVRSGPDGTTIRLRHDGRDLFLGISAPREGFASVCAASAESVAVFHASAALGLVTYRRAGNEWTTADKEFVYGMRATALTEEARAERSAYLAAHGWLASTMTMGDGRSQEMQIALDRGWEGTVARGRAVRARGRRRVRHRVARDDAAGRRLPRARARPRERPARLRFLPERWIALEMEP